MQTLNPPTETSSETIPLTKEQQKLVEDNVRLVHKALMYVKHRVDERKDLICVMHRALCEAAQKFDINHHSDNYIDGQNSVFSSYAIRGMQLAGYTHIRKCFRQQMADTIDGGNGDSDFETLADANEAKDERVEDKAAGAELWLMLDKLPSHHCAAVKGQMEGKTTRELAEELKVSFASVAIWQRKGLERLRELLCVKEKEAA